MARRPRIAPGGWIYHVLNRAVGRMKIFNSDGDFQAFLRIVKEAQERVPMRILSYCIMSNHWHFVVWPKEDGELSAFFKWMTHTHVMRWRTAHQKVGLGPLYQGRFKSLPVKKDEDFLRVCRYVERNALTAGLVERAEDWRWGSLGEREGVLAGKIQTAGGNTVGTENADVGVGATGGVGRTLAGGDSGPTLAAWPVERPSDWVSWVNEPIEPKELERWETSLKRSRPFGDPVWTMQTIKRLGLEHTVRSEGRPRREIGKKG